jgi:hypothetical protein
MFLVCICSLSIFRRSSFLLLYQHKFLCHSVGVHFPQVGGAGGIFCTDSNMLVQASCRSSGLLLYSVDNHILRLVITHVSISGHSDAMRGMSGQTRTLRQVPDICATKSVLSLTLKEVPTLLRSEVDPNISTLHTIWEFYAERFLWQF